MSEYKRYLRQALREQTFTAPISGTGTGIPQTGGPITPAGKEVPEFGYGNYGYGTGIPQTGGPLYPGGGYQPTMSRPITGYGTGIPQTGGPLYPGSPTNQITQQNPTNYYNYAR